MKPPAKTIIETTAGILDELRRLGISAKGIQSDSRRLLPGEIFAALPGQRSDGRQHISDALSRGACAILWESESSGELAAKMGKTPNIPVRGLINLTGELGHEICGRPSEHIKVCGITGTNGKTSVSQWIAQAMSLADQPCGAIGTLGNGIYGKERQPGENTTPDALTLQSTLAKIRDDGAKFCAMEVSSIGLDQGRVNAVHFDTVVFTNLTRDHLEYHGGMLQYAAAKARLFELPGIRTAVLNLDDPLGVALAGHLAGKGVQRIGYTLDENNPHAVSVDECLSARHLSISGEGVKFTLATTREEFGITSRLLGRFNVSNLLAVFGALTGMGLSPAIAARKLGELTPPAGRLQIVPRHADRHEPLVVVDYAHTPDALEQALRTLREVATARGGQLGCVFGCGGSRDPGKRPLMGRAAERHADRIIVTSDNPRNEDPRAIIDAILEGMQTAARTDTDRAAAIHTAVQGMQATDVLLIAGKGHEDYQEIAGKRTPFSDLEQAQAALARWRKNGMMSLDEAARACGGYLHQPDQASLEFSAVSTDSRKLAAGELFIALRGENFDGHDFVLSATEQGVAAALVDEAWMAQQTHAADGLPRLPLIVVADTRRALGQLAHAWRNRFRLPLIGITGSNGKTTVKEMCALILREQARAEGDDPATAVLSTLGNLNNDIGLPLMLLRLRSTHRAAVIEMGMNHPGEIDTLTRIAVPTVALINNAQHAHLEGLGSLTAVARAKGEIFAGLSSEGTAIINRDDSHGELWHQLALQAGIEHIIGFGIDGSGEVQGEYRPAHAPGGQLILHTPQGEGIVDLKVPGQHNARNAVAAAAACLAAGVPLATVVAGLSAYAGVKGRLQQRAGISGSHIIDDSYNANPDSMRAALDVLATLPGKKIFVMGDMGEVGEQSGQFHDEIGGYAKSTGVDHLLALGQHTAAAVRNFGEGAQHFASLAPLLNALRPLLDADTTVLIKGSRFMRMERVAEAIEDTSKN